MEEIVLRCGNFEATFLPGLAMLCRSLQFRGDEYVVHYRPLEAVREGRATAIPIVHPWANRLAETTYEAAGVAVDLAGVELPRDGNGIALHGNLFGAPFEVVRANATRVIARLDYGASEERLRAFPFPHVLTIDARLHPTRGLSIVTDVEPTTDRAVPVSFGWHPFLQLPNAPRPEWELRWPACEHVEVDARVIPTGTRTPQAAQREPIGDRTFDDQYALGADRSFSLVAGSGRTRRRIALEFDPQYRFAQLFVPPGREVVAIEPMTDEIDALGRGLAPVVQPGGRFRAAFNIAISTT